MRYHWNVVFPIKVLISHHTKEFGFIYSLLISSENFILESDFFILQSNHNATLANSVLRISIALSIESIWTYTDTPLCHQQKVQTTGHYSSLQYHWCRWEREGDQLRIFPCGTPIFKFNDVDWIWFQDTKCSLLER